MRNIAEYQDGRLIIVSIAYMKYMRKWRDSVYPKWWTASRFGRGWLRDVHSYPFRLYALLYRKLQTTNTAMPYHLLGGLALGFFNKRRVCHFTYTLEPVAFTRA